jgi:hypothetical protein
LKFPLQKLISKIDIQLALFATVLLIGLPSIPPVHEVIRPIGLFKLLNMEWIYQSGSYWILNILCLIAVVMYSFNKNVLPSLLIILLTYSLHYSYLYSGGSVGHSRALIIFIIIGQIFAFFSSKITKLTYRNELYRFSIYSIVVYYCTTGITKLKNSQFDWITDSTNILPQIIRLSDQQYYNFLEPADFDSKIQFVEFIAQYQWIFMLAFLLVFTLEFFSFFIIVFEKARPYWLLGLIIMHLIFGSLLGLYFSKNIYCLLIFLFDEKFTVSPMNSCIKKFQA